MPRKRVKNASSQRRVPLRSLSLSLSLMTIPLISLGFCVLVMKKLSSLARSFLSLCDMSRYVVYCPSPANATELAMALRALPLPALYPIRQLGCLLELSTLSYHYQLHALHLLAQIRAAGAFVEMVST